MKKTLFAIMAVALSATAMAQTITLEKREFGSGSPASLVNEKVDNNLYHTPQYMPGNPTAATIYPRVITVDNCIKSADGAKCDGYNWSPAMGRAEYLFVQPRKVAEPPVPVTIIKEVPGPERIILKEVPPKKKRE